MVQRMRLGAPDATGRQSPEIIEGADYVDEADLVEVRPVVRDEVAHEREPRIGHTPREATTS